jgi:hypothetical protein
MFKIALWWIFFIAIQIINIPLMFLGYFIDLWPALAKGTWLWWNVDDGDPGKTWWARYVWLAWRNPVADLRKIPGVSGAGRPLIYKWWKGRSDARTSTSNEVKSGHYVKVGWESGPPYYPVFQPFGAGRGY